MLKRPEYKPEEEKALKEAALEAACDVMARTVQQAKNDADLTEGIVFNEYTAISVLANVGVNIVFQNKGTIEEYIAWVSKEIKRGYDETSKDADLKPFVPGGIEITEEEMKKALGIVEH